MSAAKEKIVIIDDEKRMCESLAALLTSDGYEVETFQSSPEAAESIEKSRVDLVITDIKMPEMDGLKLLEVVKKVDDGIPVILMTGYGSLESAIDAISKGAYDYLLKPVEFAHFELVVKRAIDKRRAELSRLQLLEELKISNLILNRRIGELNALYEAGKSIGSTANLKELLRQIVSLASNVTEAQVGSIMLLDDSEKYLTIEAAIGLSQEIIDSTHLPVGTSIAGYVAGTGEPLIIDDVEKHDDFQRINKERYGAASLLCTPLKIKNKVIGVINMANKDGEGMFTKDDLKLLSTFASQAAIAVDDANQFEKNRRRLVEFEILHEISAELPKTNSLNDFRNMLTAKLVRVFPVAYSLWFHFDRDSHTLVPSGASGETDIPLTQSGSIDLRKINRELITLPEINLDEFDYSNIAAMSDLMARKLATNKHFPAPGEAFMAVPIVHHDELAHVFCLGADSDKAYSIDDISLAQLVISQAAVLFEKEQSLLNATRLLTMGNMISEISHDLRKPLTSIKGGLQIIRKRLPESENNSEFFRTAEEEVHRMNELVRELVDFSNPTKYQTEKVDIRQIVKRASELVGPDLNKRNIEFKSDFADENWEAIVNRNQIMEAFLNMFINAIDAMPDGGVLTIKGLVEKPEHKKEYYLAVRISDTGVGIPKDNLFKIFQRYFTTKDSGTGLGLSVVERIMSAHDGTLAVQSSEGQGTTFTLYFPYSS